MGSRRLGSLEGRLRRFVGAAVVAVAAAQPVGATDAPPLQLGVRIDAAPFASRADNGTFDGYSYDLCRAFAEHRGTAYAEIAIETAADRFGMLERGEFDLMCGATTATLEVQANFGTSLYTFVTGTAVLCRRDLPADGALVVGALAGSTIASRLGVETGLAEWAPYVRAACGLTAGAFTGTTVDSHRRALPLLRTGTIHAYVADVPILRAMLRNQPDAGDFRLGEQALTVEPYALVVRRTDSDLLLELNRFLQEHFDSDAFRASLGRHFGGVIDRTFVDLIRFQQRIGQRPLPSR